MAAVTADPARELTLYFRIDRDGKIRFRFLDGAGDPFNLTGFGAVLNFKKRKDSPDNILQLADGDGLDIDAVNGEIDGTVTKAQAVTFREQTYFWELVITDPDSLEADWLTGDAIYHLGKFDGVASDSETITINAGADTVQVTVTAGAASLMVATDYILSATEPSDISRSWVDTSSTTIPQAYPIRRYINGAWTLESNSCDWYDAVGNVISKGIPLCVLAPGQSNLSSVGYLDYGISVPSDRSKNNFISIWDNDTQDWHIPDGANPVPLGPTTDNWSWELYYPGPTDLLPGPAQLQVFAQRFTKETGRSVRVVQWRVGGTTLHYWEPGQPGYIALVNRAQESGIGYFDIIIFIHGEGGLGVGSSYSTYIESLNKGIMAGLRAESFCDFKTAFIMPTFSQAIWELRSNYDPIRSLSNGDNPYNAWTGKSSVRKKTQIPLQGATTSSTSINLDTVASGVTLTIPTGLTDNYISQVAIVSRANPTNWFLGQGSYNSGSGVLTITTDLTYSAGFQVSGSGTHTDWDVLPQDALHRTQLEHLYEGESLYNTYSAILLGKKIKTQPVITSESDGLGHITKLEIVWPSSDYTNQHWGTESIASGYALKNNFHSGLAETPGLVEAYVGAGSGQVSKQTWASEIGQATVADIVDVVAYWGRLLVKPIYFVLNSLSSDTNNTKIQKRASGGIQHFVGVNGVHEFRVADVPVLNISDGGGVSSRVISAGDIGSDDTTKGLILKSPNGHYWRQTINNSGVIAWADLGTSF